MQRALAVGAAAVSGVPLLQRWVVLLPAGRYPAEVVNRAAASAGRFHLEGAIYYSERAEFVLTKAFMGWRK